MNKSYTQILETATLALLLAFLITGALKATGACAQQGQQTPIYDKDGKYQGSVYDYGKTQTYTDRDGKFSGSSVHNNNGTTSFSNRNGNFSGSVGPSIGPSGGRR